MCIRDSLVNKSQTGSLLRLGFQVYSPDEKWGFGINGHTPIKGLWNTIYALMRNSFWTAPFIGILAFLSIFYRKAEAKILLVIPVLFILFYAGFWNTGAIEIGSRFYYPAFLALIIPACAGLLFLEEKFQKVTAPCLFIPVFLAAVAVYCIAGIYPRILKFIGEKYEFYSKPMAELVAYNDGDNTIMFLRCPVPMQNAQLTRNRLGFRNQKNIFVLYLAPEENKMLMKLFPGRKALEVTYDLKENKYIITPLNNKASAENYFTAAANYWYCVRDMEKGLDLFKKASESAPEDPHLSFALAKAYIDRKKYNEALQVLISLTQTPGYEQSWYLLGKCLGYLGKKDQSAQAFKIYMGKTKDQFSLVKAKLWMDYFQDKVQ